MSKAVFTHRTERNDDEIEVGEADESTPVNGVIYNKIYEGTEKFAGTHVGQYATGKLDRVLKLIEDTAKWSLPQRNQDKNDVGTPLERPLPWIPFLAMILMLRMTRLTLSVAGLLIGNSPLAATDVVYFIQTRRRKLRAIRIAGMRDIRRREQSRSQQQNGGLLKKLRKLLSVVACQSGQGREVHNSSAVGQNDEAAGSSAGGKQARAEINNKSHKRQRTEDDDSSDQDLTLDQIIDKYGEASSDNDSDFIPPTDALNIGDLSSQSTSSATSEDNDNNNEVIQPKGDAKPEADARITNGKRRSTNSSSSNDNQALDNAIIIKENGEHFSQSSRKPIPMPKPCKQEPIPLPIKIIKQEPLDSDDDALRREQEIPKISTEQSQLQIQQAVVAQNDENVSDGPDNKDIADNEIDKANIKSNGLENLPEIDEASGSPNLSGNFGFHPTSILKNPNAVHSEKRGPAVVYSDEDTSRADTTTYTHDNTVPGNTTQQHAKGNTQYPGKHNKNNKLRGKRR